MPMSSIKELSLEMKTIELQGLLVQCMTLPQINLKK